MEGLVLRRRPGESVVLHMSDGTIEIKCIGSRAVRLLVNAPDSVKIERGGRASGGDE